jgi:predicted acyl esterase
MLNWFRQTLLGEPKGFSNAAQVDYYERVAGEPRASVEGDWSGPFQSATWPISSSSNVLYAHGDGTLSGSVAAASAPVGPIVNTSASVNDALVGEVSRNIPGAEAQVRSVPEDGNAADSVTFESAPFEQPLRVVGAPTVQTDLAGVTGARVQVNAKLWDVSGDDAQLVWRGCTSTADGGDQLVSQSLWPNAHTFQPGHSLRLVVSTVDFPTFQPLRTPFAYSVDTAGGTRVSLPVIP